MVTDDVQFFNVAIMGYIYLIQQNCISI